MERSTASPPKKKKKRNVLSYIVTGSLGDPQRRHPGENGTKSVPTWEAQNGGALLSKHTHPKLGPSVNKLVSTVKTQHKQRLEKSLSRQNQGSQTSKAQFIWFCKTSEAHLTGLFSRMPLKIMRLKSFSPFIGASLVAQLVKNLPAMQETPIWFLGQEIHWRRERLPTPLFFGLPWWLRRWRIHKQCERPGFDPGLERSPGEEKGYPLQYSGLENSMD